MVNLVLRELLELLALLVIEVQQDSLDQPVLLDQQVIEDLQDHREAKDLLELLEIQVSTPLAYRIQIFKNNFIVLIFGRNKCVNEFNLFCMSYSI